MTASPPALRHLYRHLLRELPPASSPSALLSSPSPLHRQLREAFTSPRSSSTPSDSSTTPSSSPSTSSSQSTPNASEIDQFIRYARAQREYLALVERYNPGANMAEEERVRLTARRVGMNLPPELVQALKGKDGGEK